MQRSERALRGLLVFLAMCGLVGCKPRQKSVVLDGVTLKIAPGWRVQHRLAVGVNAKRPRVLLRHKFPMLFGAGSVSLVENEAAHGGWTMDSAKLIQDRMTQMYQQLPDATGGPSQLGSKAVPAERFDVASGKYTSLCVERHLGPQLARMKCEIVGSPLDFLFVGAPRAEPSARAMLKGLQ